MNKKSRDLELEKQIDRYIKGELTEDEAQQLWVELLKRPDYLSMLETEIDVARLHQQSAVSNKNYNQYWKWAAAAAAVVLIVIGINFFGGTPLRKYTVDEIVLSKNLATATVLRSKNLESAPADSLLIIGFKEAIHENVDEAIAAYKEVIARFPGTTYTAKAHLNIGILQYNDGRFKNSVSSFKKALSLSADSNYITEQAYWYMGNALINIEKYKQAKKALHNAAQLNGVHQKQALELLKKIDRTLEQ